MDNWHFMLTEMDSGEKKKKKNLQGDSKGMFLKKKSIGIKEKLHTIISPRLLKIINQYHWSQLCFLWIFRKCLLKELQHPCQLKYIIFFIFFNSYPFYCENFSSGSHFSQGYHFSWQLSAAPAVPPVLFLRSSIPKTRRLRIQLVDLEVASPSCGKYQVTTSALLKDLSTYLWATGSLIISNLYEWDLTSHVN